MTPVRLRQPLLRSALGAVLGVWLLVAFAPCISAAPDCGAHGQIQGCGTLDSDQPEVVALCPSAVAMECTTAQDSVPSQVHVDGRSAAPTAVLYRLEPTLPDPQAAQAQWARPANTAATPPFPPALEHIVLLN